MPNVVNVLKQDHRTVEKLFSDFGSSGDQSIVDTICEELDVHMEVEERVVYPVLRDDVSGGTQMAQHAEKEHAQARQIVGRIRQTKDADHLSELVQELKSAIEEHVQEEENEVFPKMEQELGNDRLEQLGQEVEAQKS
jgi:iron-sulfur cluster repair protein YtfE (RIC family)